MKPVLGIFWPGNGDEIGTISNETKRKTRIGDRIKGAIKLKRKAEPEEAVEAVPAKDEIVRSENPQPTSAIEKQKKYREQRKPVGSGQPDDADDDSFDEDENTEFEMPSLEFLALPENRQSAYDEKELEATAQSLRHSFFAAN